MLEKKQGVNYDNINPRGPFPPGDSIDDDIDDYLQPDDESGDKNIIKIDTVIKVKIQIAKEVKAKTIKMKKKVLI